MAGMDFKVDVREREDGYELAVDSQAGGATMRAERPFDELALKNRLLTLENALLRSSGGRRVAPTPDEREVQQFGRELFDWLFRDELRGRFDVSRSEAKQARSPLRIKLQIDSPTLAAVPWEFLYDASRGDYLALSTNTPVVRFVEVAEPIEPLKVTPPLRMLALVASPTDRPHLDAERERQRVTEATQGLEDSGLLEVHWLPGATRRDLVKALQQGPWHIFHFVGHGGFDRQSDEGIVALVDEDGATFRLSARDLARMLGDHMPLRLAVLNACEGAKGSSHDLFSSTAASILRMGTPAVVAMQYEITDRGAIEFSRAFYQAVADGNPVDVAMSAARQAMAVGGTLEWGTPVLMMRSPDGRIFDVRRTRSRKPPPSTAKPPGSVAKPPDPVSSGPGEPPGPADITVAVAGGGIPVPEALTAATVPPPPRASNEGVVATGTGTRPPGSGLSGRAIAGGIALFLAGMALVALAWAVQPSPPPSPTPTVTPSPSVPPSATPDPLAVAETVLAAQVPSSLSCRRTQGSNEQPNFHQETIGLRCDLPGIDSNMYFLYDDPAVARRPFDAGAKGLPGADCITGVPGSQEWERFQVFCRRNPSKDRAELGWFDEAHAIYGRLNGVKGSSIPELMAWWQRNAVLPDVGDLVRGTQCEAVDWAAPRGVALSVAPWPGVVPDAVVSQKPAPGFQLDPTRAVAVRVGLQRPQLLLDVTGYDEGIARRLLAVLGISTVRAIYTGMATVGTPATPGVVTGMVPSAGSRVDAASCVDLIMSGTGPLAAAPASQQPTSVPSASAPT